MSWHFSRALAAELSRANCLDGDVLVPSNGKPIPPVFLCKNRTAAFSRLSRFGMTFEPLPSEIMKHAVSSDSFARSAIGLSFRAASHAKTYQAPEPAKASTANDRGCGRKWGGSLARYDPGSHTLKIAQCSLFEESTGCFVTLPRWGMMLNGACYQRPTLAHLTAAKEFGSSPIETSPPTTPGSGKSKPPRLAEPDQELIPTPTANAAIGTRTTKYQQGGIPLNHVSILFPTPTVFGNWNRPTPGSKAGMGLEMMVKNWLTPCAADAERYGRGDLWARIHNNGRQRREYLTPKTHDYKGSVKLDKVKERAANRKHGVDLPEYLARESGTEVGGQLNPTWVEWLMGWPLGWTDLKQ